MPTNWPPRSYDPGAFQNWLRETRKSKERLNEGLSQVFTTPSSPVTQAKPTSRYLTFEQLAIEFVKELEDTTGLTVYNNPSVQKNGSTSEFTVKAEDPNGERYIIEISLFQNTFGVSAGHSQRPPLIDEDAVWKENSPVNPAIPLLKKALDAIRNDLNAGSQPAAPSNPHHPLFSAMDAIVQFIKNLHGTVGAKILNIKGVNTARIVSGLPVFGNPLDLTIEFSQDTSSGTLAGFVDGSQTYHAGVAPRTPPDFINEVKNLISLMVAQLHMKSQAPQTFSALDLNQTAGYISQYLRTMQHAQYYVTNLVLAKQPNDVVTTVYSCSGHDPDTLDIEVSKTPQEWVMKVRWMWKNKTEKHQAAGPDQSAFFTNATNLLFQLTSDPANFLAQSSAASGPGPQSMPLSVSSLNSMADDIVATLKQNKYTLVGSQHAATANDKVRFKFRYSGTSTYPSELEIAIFWSAVTGGFKMKVNWEYNRQPMKAMTPAEADPRTFYDLAQDYLKKIIASPYKTP